MRLTITVLMLITISFLYSSSLKKGEDVLFLDNYGYFKSGKLNFVINARVYQNSLRVESKNRFSTSLKNFLTINDSNEIFKKRILPFNQNSHKNKIISIILNQEHYSLNYTLSNGFTQTYIMQDSAKNSGFAGKKIAFNSKSSASNPKVYGGEATVIASQGVSIFVESDHLIISPNLFTDLDYLTNSFAKDYQVETMMVKFLTNFQKKGFNFFYYSALPIELFSSIKSFLNQSYPVGTLLLNSTYNSNSVEDFLNQDKLMLKRNVLEGLLRNLVHQNFVLVLNYDSKLPQAIDYLQKKFPNKIIAIYLKMPTKEFKHLEIKNEFSNLKNIQFFTFYEAKDLLLNIQNSQLKK